MPKVKQRAPAHQLAPSAKRRKTSGKLSPPEKERRAAERAAEKALWKRREQVFRAMPFINSDGQGEGRDFWDVKETGDAYLDGMLGEQLATQFLRFGREEGDELGGVFIGVIESMIEKGPDYCAGVRLGFLHRLKHLIPAGYRFDDDGELALLMR